MMQGSYFGFTHLDSKRVGNNVLLHPVVKPLLDACQGYLVGWDDDASHDATRGLRFSVVPVAVELGVGCFNLDCNRR